MRFFKLLCASALTVVCMTAGAHEFEALGEKFKFTEPEGYCALDENSSSDKKLLQFLRKAAGKGLDLEYAAVHCSDLELLRNGDIELPEHYLGAGVLAIQGMVAKFPLDESLYLMLVSKLLNKQVVNSLVDRFNQKYQNKGGEISDTSFDMDQSGSFIFANAQAHVKINSKFDRTIRAKAASRLLKQVPLVFYVYDETDEQASYEKMDSALKTVTDSLE
ncbi:MAG: hypothetical protein J5934_03050 [Succinivibrio sp.]|nr:hypothetical protein [Succinivibrio sp.]